MGYLDNDGLSYLWGKIKAALSGKQSKIEANGILKGDGTGGVTAAEPGTDYLAESDIVICHITSTTDADGNTVKVSDMTPTEISNANKSGKTVFARAVTADYQLQAAISGLYATFLRVRSGWPLIIDTYRISSSKVATSYTYTLGKGVAICEITGTYGNYSASMSAAQIETARAAGQIVIAMYSNTVLCMSARTVASGETTPTFTFVGLKDLGTAWRGIVSSDGSVTVGAWYLQRAELVNNFNAPNTYQYPSTSAVWNAIPHAETKTDEQTQAVGMDADGKLWTKPAEASLKKYVATNPVLTTVDGTDRFIWEIAATTHGISNADMIVGFYDNYGKMVIADIQVDKTTYDITIEIDKRANSGKRSDGTYDLSAGKYKVVIIG